MKKIVFLFLITLSSCTEATWENSVENPEQFTTVEIQNLPRDTVEIAMKEYEGYIFKDNVVVARVEVINDSSIRQFRVADLFIVTGMGVVLGILIGAFLKL